MAHQTDTQFPVSGAMGPPPRPSGTGTMIFGVVMLASLVVPLVLGPFLFSLVPFLVVVVGATISAKNNRLRVAGFCALATVGFVCLFVDIGLALGFGSILWIAGAVGVFVEGVLARNSSTGLPAATRAPVPLGYTEDGRPIYPVIGYTPDGVAVTADRVVGAVPSRSGTNSMAIVALIGGLVLAPVGIVCGHVALAQISTTRQEGRGLAIAGLILGYSWLALAIAVIIGMAVFYQI